MGWLPFALEAADYSYLGASRAGRPRGDDLLPSELFRRQVYVTYWFEQIAPTHLLDVIPVDNVLFETDFPHTTCLYGNIPETIERGLGHVTDEVRREDPVGQRRRALPDRGVRAVSVTHPPPVRS